MSNIGANYVKIGIFVTLAIFLGIFAILVLSATSFTRNETLFETYMEGSVQGLEVGGDVKYRGIPIGSIKKIALIQPTYTAPNTPEGQRALRYARIVFVVDRDKFCRQECDTVVAQVAEGLRVFQKNIGITGMMYIDLDFIDKNSDQTTLPVPWTPEHLYIPSARSLAKEVTALIEHLSNQLSTLDLHEPVAALTEILQSIKTDLRTADIGEAGKSLVSILEKADAMTTTINQWIESGNLSKTSDSLSEAVASIERTAKEVESSLPALMQRGAQLVERADGIALDSRNTIAETLENLRRTTDSLAEALDKIKENPSILIRNAQED